ncbi:SIS domain-containing protein [Alphaproteobacteria bacterium]|nr:SIS domain-containing protein [Alphaproteobacteria bacterium]
MMSRDNLLKRNLSLCISKLSKCFLKAGCLYVAGNGGSAADSQHFVAEFISKLSRDRDPIKAISLTVDTSILTAIGNDYGFEKVFSRQLDALINPHDVFFAITTSGKSKNILNGLKKAKEKGATTILLTSKNYKEKNKDCDLIIKATGDTTAQIQETHLIIYHTICCLVEKNLIDKNFIKYRD